MAGACVWSVATTGGAADRPGRGAGPVTGALIVPLRIPPEYRVVYEQTFTTREGLGEFVFSDPAAWRFASTNGNGALELAHQSRYQPPVRSPVNIALLAGQRFGDFILEVDLIQTGKEYGHRDMCVFFGMQDPTHFYYTHIATAADDHAHNTFIVTNAPRVKIARETTAGVSWGLGVWHKVRIERTLADGGIKVYFDDFSRPIMVAEDKTFGWGYVGFGSFDDTGMVDNIRIWGPRVEAGQAGFFRRAPGAGESSR